jgi:Zn-dependent peptidase ImmA (M78 family)
MPNLLQISPKIIQWAAMQAGNEVDAFTIGMSEKKKNRFLAGELAPKDAEEFSKFARVPFGFLFLETPPENIRPSIPDLRQTKNPKTLSLNFYDVLEDALRKQDWFKDYLKKNGQGQVLDFVESYKKNTRPKIIAGDIWKRLDLSSQERDKCANYKEYFNVLSERFEKLGILIFKRGFAGSNTHQTLDPSEFRGFALADKVVPVIFINGRDAESAQIFTLIHEAAHIWLGESGISDQHIASSGLEKYCNQVAAEILVPEKEFCSQWDKEKNCAALAKHFKVSRLVIARRAFEYDLISQDTYDQELKKAYYKGKKTGGGDYYAALPVANSKRLTRAIVTSALSGETLLREAASLLFMRPDNILKLHQYLER